MTVAYVLRAGGHDVEVGFVDSHPGQSYAECETCGWVQVHVMPAHSDAAASRHVRPPTPHCGGTEVSIEHMDRGGGVPSQRRPLNVNR